MADAVATQTVFDGDRLAIQKFTNISDGTGESKVLKVDVSTLLPNNYGIACDRVTITKIHAATTGMSVEIFWDADTDVLCQTIAPDSDYSFDFEKFGGLPNNAGTGVTGDVLFSTVGASSGDLYTITLEMVKHYPNPFDTL